MNEEERPKKRGRTGIIIAAAVVLLAGAGGAYWYASRPAITIPKAVASTTPFPIYLPQQLPQGFTIDQNSFQYISSEQVLVFTAQNVVGDTLAFTEQRKPAGVNFKDFNTNQLVQPKTLPNTPFPSTVGKTLDKQTTMLSIITKDTWITVTTQSELSNQDIHDIAGGIAKY